MAILNRILGKISKHHDAKVLSAYKIDSASKAYLENQRLAASDTRILL